MIRKVFLTILLIFGFSLAYQDLNAKLLWNDPKREKRDNSWRQNTARVPRSIYK